MGEVDWWQNPPLDFFSKIEQNPDLQKFLFDPLGVQAWLRPNFLHPPFNNKKARQALLHMMDQVTYLAWAASDSQYYRTCYSVFACGGPYETRIGTAPIVEHDLTKARQLVQESGCDGYPVVVIQVTDWPLFNAAAFVTRQRLESIGFKVILKPMDWATNLIVRARKDPPDKGGWNCFTPTFRRPTSSIPLSISPYRARGRAPGTVGRIFRSSKNSSTIGWARRMNRNGSDSPMRSRGSLMTKYSTSRGDKCWLRRRFERTSETSSNSQRRFFGMSNSHKSSVYLIEPTVPMGITETTALARWVEALKSAADVSIWH